MGCKICGEKVLAKQMCNKHYKRQYRGVPVDGPDRLPAILPKPHSFYMAWTNMKTRCDNPKSTQWKYYGGRGITYCPEWAKFQNFYDSMFSSWQPGLELDRRDNDLGYSPQNCRWVTHQVNSSNRRAWGACNV